MTTPAGALSEKHTCQILPDTIDGPLYTAEQLYIPPGHFSNPMENIMAATQYLNSLPIPGNSPGERVARQAIAWLQTTITQQAQYSVSCPHLHVRSKLESAGANKLT